MLDSAKQIQSKMNFVHTALVQKTQTKIYPQGTFCLPVLEGLTLSYKPIFLITIKDCLDNYTFHYKNQNKITYQVIHKDISLVLLNLLLYQVMHYHLEKQFFCNFRYHKKLYITKRLLFVVVALAIYKLHNHTYDYISV